MEKKEFEQLLKVLLKSKIKNKDDFNVFWNNCHIDDDFNEIYIELRNSNKDYLGKIFINIEQFKSKMKDETDLEFLVPDLLEKGDILPIKCENYASFLSFMNEEYSEQKYIVYNTKNCCPCLYLSNYYTFNIDAGSITVKYFYNILNK